MNELFLNINDDVKDLENQLGNPTFVYDGTEYNCLPSDFKQDANGSNIGYYENSNLTLIVRLDQFGTDAMPKIKQHLTYMNSDVLINSITKPVHNVFWVYNCSNPEVKIL